MRIISAALSVIALSCVLAASDTRAQQAAPPTPEIAAPQNVPYPGVITLDVDATDVQRGIYRVHESIPVEAAGPLTLLFPQWLPGTHAPEGELEKFVGLTLSANGQ